MRYLFLFLLITTSLNAAQLAPENPDIAMAMGLATEELPVEPHGALDHDIVHIQQGIFHTAQPKCFDRFKQCWKPCCDVCCSCPNDAECCDCMGPFIWPCRDEIYQRDCDRCGPHCCDHCCNFCESEWVWIDLIACWRNIEPHIPQRFLACCPANRNQQ